MNQPFLEGFTYELTAPGILQRRPERIDLDHIPPKSIVAQTVFSVLSPGTECAAWLGKPPLRPSKVYPRVLGYCNVARVVAVGSDVVGITPGNHILTHQCHRSVFCCDASKALLVCPSSLSHASQQRMAASYLYHISYMSLIDGGYRPGYEAAVIGFGALGFTAASLVSAYGGRPLVFSSRPPLRDGPGFIPHARFYEKMGDDTVVAPGSMGGVDLVINTSDSWDDYALGLRLARRGGTIALVGFPGRGLPPAPHNPLDSQFFYDKALHVFQVAHDFELDVPAIDVRFTLKRNLEHIFGLLEDGRLDPAPLISTRFKSDELAGALDLLATRRSEAKSALLEWPC